MSGGASAPAITGGGGPGDLLPQLDGVMSALKALAATLGGGTAAAVAGASGDAEGGGPAKDAKSSAGTVGQVAGQTGVGQGPVQVAPTKVAGDSGPGQFPNQSATQRASHSMVGGVYQQGAGASEGKGKSQDKGTSEDKGTSQVKGGRGKGKGGDKAEGNGNAHANGNGNGHVLRRGRGHLKHMGPLQSSMQLPLPGQVAGQAGSQKPIRGGGEGGTPVQRPVTQVAGESSAPVQKPITEVGGESGTPVQKPVTQVGGESGTPAQVEPAPVQKPVTQVGGESGTPAQVEPAPVQKPVTQVGGQSGTPAQAGATPVQGSGPIQAPSEPKVSNDVRLIELDHLNSMQLMASDRSYLYFSGDGASYRSRSGVVQELKLPPTGFSMTLSDGTKVSYGLHEKTGLGETAGTPRDLEVLGADSTLFAARTDDGEHTNWAMTPLTSFHLLEIASTLLDGSYAKFGSGSGETVQQGGTVVQKTT